MEAARRRKEQWSQGTCKKRTESVSYTHLDVYKRQVWIPDKLLTVTIPSFLYYLWNADVIFFFFGIQTPHPATLFNDGLTPQKAVVSIISYLVVLAVSLVIYYAGCKRRCENA